MALILLIRERASLASARWVVVDDVDWTVMGTHPLAGHYHSKAAFVAGTFETLDRGPRRRHAARCRADHRQGRSGRGRAALVGDRQKRPAIRQSPLLDRVLP
jgi:hypothetical protein